MRSVLTKYLTGAVMAAAVCLWAGPAFGQAKITMDDGRSLTIGGGLRTSFRTTETGPDTGDYNQDILLDSVRLYFNAQVAKDLQVEFNTDYGQPDSDLRVLDAVVKYTPSPYFNVWMGRHLPPSDRANLAGPYFANAYDYPGLVSRYPAIFAGRDNGVMVNGEVSGGTFKYAGGVYDGAPNVLGTPNSMLWATRVVYNVLDPESGYYNNGTYYGDKKVLAIGLAAQHQANVVDVDGTPGDFTGVNVDVLFETKLPSAGVVTLEGAAYDYDLDGAPGDGQAYLATAAYLFPQTVGVGRLQPEVRYQKFSDDSAIDAALNYVIRGHNARLSAVYTRTGPDGARENQFTIGTQFQF